VNLGFKQRLLAGICILLIPRIAFAHGESLIPALFWDAATIPWAVIAFLVAGRKVADPTARNRLGPLTLLATLLALFGGWFVVTALGQIVADPAPLAPVVLLLSGAPAVWYLWRERERGWAMALLLIPLALAGSCEAMMMPRPTTP
jgi:hypothetical protein